jgi:hypothetical protein
MRKLLTPRWYYSASSDLRLGASAPTSKSIERADSMAVSEYDRTQLFVWFEEHMGKERATTMMNLLPPVGWGDVATRRDLDLLEERIEAKLGAMATKQELSSMQASLKQDISDLRSDLQRTFVTWIFAAQATAVAAIGLLLAFLR